MCLLISLIKATNLFKNSYIVNNFYSGGSFMYDNIDDFKERLEEDSEFKQLFLDVTNLDDAVALARENGYNLDVDEVVNDIKLADDILDVVAGGSDKNRYDSYDNI